MGIKEQAAERGIVWEPCDVNIRSRGDIQYRGMDVHWWAPSYRIDYEFLCVYPREGNATEVEITDMIQRVCAAGLGDLLRSLTLTRHGECNLTERQIRSGNCCFEVDDFTSLDAVLDGLWAAAFQPVKRRVYDRR